MEFIDLDAEIEAYDAMYHDEDFEDEADDDCMECGYCESCIDRSIEYAREMNDREQSPE